MVAHDVRPPHLPAELLLLGHVGLARVPVGSVADEREDVDVDHQHEEVHRGEPEEAEEDRTAPVPAQRLRLRRDGQQLPVRHNQRKAGRCRHSQWCQALEQDGAQSRFHQTAAG